MVLVVYEANGVITQIITQAQVTLDVLAEKYAAANTLCVLHSGDADMFNSYVVEGQVTPKPELQIVGDVRPIKADDNDTLRFTITPGNVNVGVFFSDTLIHQQDVNGSLEFSVAVRGSYKLVMAGPFPYRSATLEIEAV